ncbi:hypothetical protein BX600DRAFT_452536 [Xylariales sp. PMI_506]|nr:hypothetical protein BX600DRAFT_452536 [Xylariales sp. PMI_506]
MNDPTASCIPQLPAVLVPKQKERKKHGTYDERGAAQPAEDYTSHTRKVRVSVLPRLCAPEEKEVWITGRWEAKGCCSLRDLSRRFGKPTWPCSYLVSRFFFLQLGLEPNDRSQMPSKVALITDIGASSAPSYYEVLQDYPPLVQVHGEC